MVAGGVKGTSYDGPVEWLDIPDPEDPQIVYRINLTFLSSTWGCMFGKGCPGLFGKDEKHTQPDMGCCRHGVLISETHEYDDIDVRVETLLDTGCLNPCGADYIRRNGWYTKVRGRNSRPMWNTRIRDGGCVFANRADEGPLTGCAFVELAKRTGAGHIDTMPRPCWQLPLAVVSGVDAVNDGSDIAYREVIYITAWDADYWGGADDDGTHDSWAKWWCTETPDAYLEEKEPLYVRMSRELHELLGTAVFRQLMDHMRKTRPVTEMPGAVRYNGRKMLPLLVEGRTPKRVRRDGNDN